MQLEPGKNLLHYRLIDKLGEGGMGVVWKALDTTLDREVAIKLLPDTFAGEPERLARFEREAKLLASLNHPHIAGIYGIHEVDGVRFLSMELVHGEDLSDLLARGSVPLDRALEIARQVAEALETAHDNGVIHRDLKPANVRLTAEGKAKVLDFGLAKAYDPAAASDPMHSATLTSAGTVAGMILGTAAYMSPEQASGQPTDRRADIWSFGVMLYEMVCGRRLFDGETISHTIADVLRQPIDLDTLPAGTPPSIRRLIERCLDRDRMRRLRDIGEARIIIDDTLAGDTGEVASPAGAEATAAGVAEQPAAAPSRLPWIVAALLAVGLVAAVGLLWPKPPAPVLPVQTNLVLPDGQTLFRGYGSSIVLSPDGTQLAYVANVPGEGRILFLRALDQWDAIPLVPGNEAYHPFFSPDGSWVGFVTRQGLYKVPVRGGSPIKLTDVELSRGASWGEDGTIVFAAKPTGGLSRVSEAGGEPEALTEAAEDETHRWPQFLPGGKAVLFTSAAGNPDSFDEAQIELVILESGERRVLHRGGTYARYVSSGHLVFANGESLFAAPFDLDALEVTGSIVPVQENVSTHPEQGGAQFDVASTGRMVFASEGGADLGFQLVRVGRSGDRVALADERRPFANPELSPDQKFLAVEISVEGKSDVWVYDLERGLPTRITSGVGSNSAPIWSPDGQWIYYGVSAPGFHGVERIAADGSGEPEQLLEAETDIRPLSISPDGRELLLRESVGGRPDLRRWSADTGEIEPLIETPAIDYTARFSPDGRWIAYGTNESDSFEVYIIPTAGGRGRWQVSDVGIYPLWSADGKTLFYRGFEDGKIYEVPIQAGTGSIRAGRPRLVVGEGPYLFIQGADNDYAVAADGQTFIMLEQQIGSQETHEHVNLVLDWDDALRSITGGP